MEESKDILKDSYFIRLTDNKGVYVHFIQEEGGEEEYVLKHGLVGACMFKKSEANNFILAAGASNMEAVSCDSVLNADSNFKMN